METHLETDVVIAGGGLNGCALARALSTAGLDVVLVDPERHEHRRAPGFDGRSYALSLGSVNLLRALELWSAVEAEAQPILEIKVSDGRAGEGPSPFHLHFDHAEIDEGPMGQMVEDRHLRPALLGGLDGVEVLEGRRVTAHQASGTALHATCDDGTVIAARLIVGCDGRRSPTARRAGISRTHRDYGQNALVAAIAHEKAHDGIAHQFFMPEGPLAILPLKGRRSSIVWTESTARAAELTALPEEDYLDVLRPRFGDFLGDIGLDGARFTYPLALSLANRLTTPRVALAGDAAHAVHPIAGQGLNAGLKDVATLAQVLVEAAWRGEDIGRAEVLERYARWRRLDTATLGVATDGFNRLFSNDNPLLRLGRDLGMGAVNALPRLRRGFIREAAGLTGDRPDLLRGKPL